MIPIFRGVAELDADLRALGRLLDEALDALCDMYSSDPDVPWPDALAGTARDRLVEARALLRGGW